MNKLFGHLIERVVIANDEQAVAGALGKLATEAGFDFFTYLNDGNGTYTIVSNYPQVWQQRYDDRGYLKIDPVILGLRYKTSAFAWSAQTLRMSREQRAFFAEAAQSGIRSGLTIPVNAGFGHVAVLTLASADSQYAETRRYDPSLAAAALGQIHARLAALSIAPKLQAKIHLKPDELTCLRWSTEGKTMRAIAQIENMSYANVCFYLHNAKVALGATSLIQAARIATTLGLL